MSTEAPNRKLAAILHADVVGYSRLMGLDETGTHRLLRQHLDAITEVINDQQGRVVNYSGDAVLADFTTVSDALSAALSIQETIDSRNQALALAEDRQVLFRIGIHLGEVIIDGDDIYGDGVNVAARLEGLADPGGICISESVRSAIGGKLDLNYEFMGEREVKNISEPVRAYRVVAGDIDHGLPACPYPGMVPFAAKDAAYFYGRDDEINRMVQLLRRQRFLMVIGPSGSGKSSLVYAGLLPALAKSRYFTDGYWLIRTLRPGPQPTETLAKALGAEGNQGTFAPDTVDRLLKNNSPAERLLLLVDQFEEVFTQADKDERARFIAELQALRVPDNCALILTLRADFYPDLMNSYLWPVDSSQRIEVAPLRGEALRAAIEQPAAGVGVRIEESLINQLLVDAADEPGVLPLLQETMGLLWEEMEQRSLSLSAYQQLSRQAGLDDNGDLSGLAVAIAMKADSTLLELSPSQQTIARRIFLRLIQFGEGRADTRRQQPVSALRAATDEPDELEHTLEHLTDNRLLTRSGGDEQHPSAVDISHESLINGWSRLQDWAEERREAEQIRRRLEGKAAEWVRLGKGTGGLLSDVELPEAEHWLGSADAADLGFDETLPELVTASQQALETAAQEREAVRQQELRQAEALAEEQRQRIEEQGRAAGRMRRMLAGLGVVLMIAVAAGFIAWIQNQKAQSLATQEAAARQEAETRRIAAQKAEQEAKRLAQSEAEARSTAEKARLESIAQLLTIEAPRQQAALLDEAGALMARQAYLFSRTGKRSLQMQVDNVLRTVMAKPHFSPTLLRTNAYTFTFSPDGTTLASAHIVPDKVLLWNLKQHGAPPQELAGFPGHIMTPGTTTDPIGKIFAIDFSPDGKTLIAANSDGSVGRWDLSKLENPVVEIFRQPGGAASLRFSPDGHWLAIGSKLDDTFSVLDLGNPSNEPVIITDPQPAASGNGVSIDDSGGVTVAFSVDSKLLATGSLTGIIRLWHPGDLTQPVASLRGHQDRITSMVFDDANQLLISGSQDGSTRIWDLNQPTPEAKILTEQSDPVRSLTFDSTKRILASASYTGGIKLWNINDSDLSKPVAVVPAVALYKIAFSPDGRYLASGGTSQSYLRLWDREPNGRQWMLSGHEADVISLAFSPDMALLASGGGAGDGTIRIWNWDNLNLDPKVFQTQNTDTINSVNFSADGHYLVAASWIGNWIRLWDLSNQDANYVSVAVPDSMQPWTAMFHPDGKHLVASGTGGLFSWPLNKLDTAPKLLVASEKWATEISFSPDGSAVALANYGPAIFLKFFNSPDQPVHQLLGHEGTRSTWSVAYSPDGNQLASGGFSDSTVRLWNPNEPTKESIVLGQHDETVTRVRFSPDGQQLASTSVDYNVRLWDMNNPNAQPIILSGHEGQVWSLAYSADGKHLVTGSRDKSIRIWDLTHPLNSASIAEVADRICKKVWRNMTLDEWQKFIGEDIPYDRTCPNLPIHSSLFETAEKSAKEGNKEEALALLERAVKLDPKLDINSYEEIDRWLRSAKQ